jgi:thiamine biosynthesis lipoprotein
MFKFIFLFISLLNFACSHKPKQSIELKTIEGRAFGSSYELRYIGDAPTSEIKEISERFLKNFDREFSTYRPDSVISQFNRLKPFERLKVSKNFTQLLGFAQQLHTITQGAFDPSIGESIRLWGFGGGEKKVPTSKQLKQARKNSGMNHIVWDEVTNEVWKTGPLILDVNAFAPGLAVDWLAEELDKLEIRNFMLNIGGEISFKGNRPDGSPWVGGIETPNDKSKNEVYLAFKISNLSLATSGNYRQFWILNGKKISHTINPLTHQPVDNGIVSASVITDSAVSADAWSTAMMVHGKDGLELAEKNGIKVLLIERLSGEKFHVITNESMKIYLDAHQVH